MATDTIPARAPRQLSDADWWNVFRTALGVDYIPRSTAGVASDQAGSLGDSSSRFLDAYLMGVKLFSGSYYIEQLSPSLAASLVLTWLASYPASKLPLLLDNTGAITSETITRAMRASANYSVSSGSSGNFSTPTSAGEVNVTNLSVTLTTTGRPVQLAIIGDASGNISRFIAGNDTTSADGLYIRFKRDGTSLYTYRNYLNEQVASAIKFLDTPAAGTYTYTVTAQQTGSYSLGAPGSEAGFLSYVKLVAFEME